MIFINLLEKVERPVNKGYAGCGIWLWVTLFMIITFGAYFEWENNQDISAEFVTLIFHGKLERPILRFSVNGIADEILQPIAQIIPMYLTGETICCSVIKEKGIICIVTKYVWSST